MTTHPDRSTQTTMRIIAFGTYQADSHPRVRVLIEGLRAQGHDVLEINEPLGLSTAERVSMLRKPWTLPVLGLRLAHRWTRLARRGRSESKRQPPDAVLVGYLGHFDVHLARRVFHGTPIVLDHLIFAAGTAVDRGSAKGLVTGALEVLDRRALRAADVIVLDTAEHRDRVPEELSSRALVAAVGADATWFEAGGHASPAPALDEPVRVVFFGLFTPLQGAVVIGEALNLLHRRGFGADRLRVTMIGSGQDLAAAQAAAGPEAPAEWVGWVDPARLPAVVASHQVALGIFGTTPKGADVVPNKVYQSAAAGCAIITSDTRPQRRVLGEAAEFVPVGDPSALADAIARLVEDRQLLVHRRRQARELALSSFTGGAVVLPLLDRLADVPLDDVSTAAASKHSAPVAPLTPRAALRWPLIKRAMKQTRPATTLEIGCGQGAMGARLVGLTPSFTAVEPDVSSYQIAKERIGTRGGTVLNCTSDELDDDRTFDMVCAFEVLEHLEDDTGALDAWVKKVRIGGHLVLSVPAWQHMFGTWDKAVGHYRRYSPDELATKLRAAGFEPVKIGLYGWPLAFLLEAIRNRVADGSAQMEDSAADQTAHSGRWLQPTKRLSAIVITVGIFPFQVMQRLVQSKGNGIVALARRVS
ncbi:glycosyltransferase involved in cell wall biosynthesis [Nakamurella sp. UYEF19]|uniref:methyltransferase domain-containing protein n=1 Tax=Nakamurella sp. UYEF19 TaxID=1756392 RepID=UPI003391E2E9